MNMCCQWLVCKSDKEHGILMYKHEVTFNKAGLKFKNVSHG